MGQVLISSKMLRKGRLKIILLFDFRFNHLVAFLKTEHRNFMNTFKLVAKSILPAIIIAFSFHPKQIRSITLRSN